MDHLDPRVLAAWAATPGLHRPGPPAAPGDVTAAEQVLGHRLPRALADLHLQHDGGDWFHGSLQLLPLDGDELSVTRASATHRGWGWPIPEELLVVGSSGDGDPFGLWLDGAGGRPLVVQVGQLFEPGCMAVVGEDLNAFLVARTAYHLLGEDGAAAGLDALGVPDHLRSDDPCDEEFVAISDWANPTLAGAPVGPYEARLTADDVRRAAAAR